MARTYALNHSSEIPAGEGRNFEVGGEKVALFRTRAGNLFACQAECPHKRGPLADGLVGDGFVVCPLHEWQFDLSTGKTQNGTCHLAVYPVTETAEGMM